MRQVPTGYLFTYGSAHSQSQHPNSSHLPPGPCPQVHFLCLSLFLPCKQVHLYQFSIYVLIYDIVFLFLTYFTPPKYPSADEQVKKVWTIYNGILLSHKKEQNWVICRDMEGSPLVVYGLWVWTCVHTPMSTSHDAF